MRSKARLTITLPRELLGQIDHLIDKRTVRNRSHAIELLLRKSLKPSVSTAVLLAGGSAGAERPPALLPIQGQPLIVHTINHLIDNGISSFIILAGESESLIRRYLGHVDNRGAEFHFVNETQPLGTAGALKAAERYISDEPFLVFHGDILTDINVADFVEFHSSQNRLATIAVKPRRAEPDYGKVMMEGIRITDFIPENHDQGISIVNTGVYLFEPEVLSLITSGTAIWLETGIFPRLAKMGELSAFLFQGIWFDISNSGNYESALVRWQRKGGDNHEGQS